MILDEATAYTDPENEAILQNSIAKLVAGKTLIVIAHRLSTVKDSDQIFIVNDGNVTAHGTHEEDVYKRQDLIVQKAIIDKQYDIMQLNVTLFRYTNEILGV